jgi:uncharacterized protein YgiM (DUF1202 family)
MPELLSETMRELSPDTLPLVYINVYTNQQLIDAFFDAANQLNNGDYQTLLVRAGLDVNQLAADRNGLYVGPQPAQLSQLSPTEREQIYRGLLGQLQHQGKPGQVSAPDGLNLRAGPGRDHDVLASLPFGSNLTVLSEVGTSEDDRWLLVTAGAQTGWLFASLVDRNPDENQRSHPDLTTTAYTGPLAAATPLQPPANASLEMASAAATWNDYGGLILAECTRLNFDPAVAVAILGVESSGRAFEGSRMIIRFENHLFLHYWGQAHRDLFDRHFTSSADGSQHRWRPDPNGDWLPCHTNQATEWQVFELARSLDETAAMYSISMGAAQVMGFNYASIGYPSVQAMFAAFQADVRNQLSALFRFIEVNNLEEVARKPNFVAFARIYNGQGQEAIYAPRMQRFYDAYRQLVAGRGVGVAVGRLPQPGAPSLLNADPELLAAWRKHIASGFANNETMFRDLLQGFLRPYWTTVWMYRILFALGVLSFLLAAGLAIFSGRVISVFTFGGLSAIAILGYFFNRPLQALEQNIQFLTWLGIVYNTYWTRLTLLNNESTVQSDISEVTDEAIARIQELVAEHAKRSKSRQGFGLPSGDHHE